MSKGTVETSPFAGVEFNNILKCVHCGLCLEACPTYRELGVEQDSPRGRLYLMRGLWEGELALTPEVVAPLSRCLDCRACETACPSEVPYGELLEKTRAVLHQQNRPPWRFRVLRWLVFNHLLNTASLLVWFSKLSRLYQRLKLAQNPFFRRLLPRFVRDADHLMPRFSGRSFKRDWRRAAKSTPATQKPDAPVVALFAGCVMDVAENQVHQATVKLLQAAGCQVEVPQGQVCCGALHVHNGETEKARLLARKNQTVFAEKKYAALVVNSAGCGAQLRDYQHLFSQKEAKEWHALRQLTIDWLVLLSRQPGFPAKMPWVPAPATVLYDAPCHLRHAMQVDAVPLLQKIPGLTVVPLANADTCCGAAGIYNLVHQQLSGQILDRKIEDIAAAMAAHPQAMVLLTGNPGCLFQIRGGVKRAGLDLQVMHPAEFLAARLTQG